MEAVRGMRAIFTFFSSFEWFDSREFFERNAMVVENVSLKKIVNRIPLEK